MNTGQSVDSKEERFKGKKYSVIVIGPPHVGKSSVIQKYVYHSLPRRKFPTQGVELYPKLDYHEPTNTNVKLYIWDISGHDKYKEIVVPHFRKSHACMLVCNIDVPNCMEGMEPWLEKVKKYCGPRCVCALVGYSKGDRQVEQTEAINWAIDRGFLYFETNAEWDSYLKRGCEVGVNILFLKLVDEVMQKHGKSKLKRQNSISLRGGIPATSSRIGKCYFC